MSIFSQSRTKRDTAFMMLLALLFALASGIVNACLLETGDLHSDSARLRIPIASQSLAVFTDSSGAVSGHEEDSDNSKESCLKVCDDGTRTLPNANTGVDPADPGLALFVTTRWAASTHDIRGSRPDDRRQAPVVGPPVRVRYSRLAL